MKIFIFIVIGFLISSFSAQSNGGCLDFILHLQEEIRLEALQKAEKKVSDVLDQHNIQRGTDFPPDRKHGMFYYLNTDLMLEYDFSSQQYVKVSYFEIKYVSVSTNKGVFRVRVPQVKVPRGLYEYKDFRLFGKSGWQAYDLAKLPDIQKTINEAVEVFPDNPEIKTLVNNLQISQEMIRKLETKKELLRKTDDGETDQ